ncbi:MAG TPA: hypothetical protein VFQ05_03045 [Candidatus Eisenbacteria bacterium]|nr:hypothetical protein [Candidatus Eisenbacteria bacterium]
MRMKRWRGVVFTVVMAASGPAAADDFDDFRIPAHDLIDWRVQLGLDGSQVFQSIPVRNASDRSLAGRAGTGFVWLSDSDPMMSQVSLLVTAAGLGRWTHQETFGFGYLDGEDRRGVEDWNASFTHRRYPGRAIGIELSVFGSGSYRQQWSGLRQDVRQVIGGSSIRDVGRASAEQWDYATAVSTRLMIGVGHVRDASSIYEARVLEERLLETGGLTRSLSPAARQKLAALLTTRFQYEFFRERPARAIWDRIEDILREDGVLADGGLTPDAVLRAGEPHTRGGLMPDVVPRSPVLRRVGGFVGPSLLDQHASYVTRIDASSFTQTSVDDSLWTPVTGSSSYQQDATNDETFLGMRGEYYRPLGMSWQADVSGEALFPTRSGVDGTLGSASGRLSWMLADHWEASGFLNYNRFLLQNDVDTVDDRWSWLYGVSATWYVQDRLQLTILASEQQSNRKLSSGFMIGDQYVRAGAVSLALTYRILGGFGAPGLIPREAL